MAVTGADRARELEVFVAVATTGSFSGAGRATDMTPSGVSRTIDRLEARLGARLMLRSTRALTLTPEGQTYLGAARRILADLDEADRVIVDLGAPQGRVRVTGAISHGRHCIVPLLAGFAERYPKIVVDVHLTDAMIDVAAGQADVAIRSGVLPDSTLTARRLSENGRTIVASPAYLARRGTPRTPGDLLDHDCLNFNFRRTEPVWPFRENGIDHAMKIDGVMEANSGETLCQLALAGVGIARLGNFCLDDHIPQGRLVPLLEEFNPSDSEVFQAVFVGGPNMPARVRVFVDYLVERMRG